MRLSLGTDGNSATGLSYAPVLAADGRTLVFASFADNLVENDRNRRADLFLVSLPGAESEFRIVTITRVLSGTTTLIWVADPERTYHLEYTENLAPADWHRLDVPILVHDGLATAEDPTAMEMPRRYYRIAATEPEP